MYVRHSFFLLFLMLTFMHMCLILRNKDGETKHIFKLAMREIGLKFTRYVTTQHKHTCTEETVEDSRERLQEQTTNANFNVNYEDPIAVMSTLPVTVSLGFFNDITPT